MNRLKTGILRRKGKGGLAVEKINFPQIVSQSDLYNPLDPGKNQIDIFALTDEPEPEKDKEEHKN